MPHLMNLVLGLDPVYIFISLLLNSSVRSGMNLLVGSLEVDTKLARQARMKGI